MHMELRDLAIVAKAKTLINTAGSALSFLHLRIKITIFEVVWSDEKHWLVKPEGLLVCIKLI